MENKQKKLNYAYVVYVLAFLMIFVGIGFAGNVRTLFLNPVCEGLNVERDIFSLSDSIRFISTAVMNFAFGFLLRKIGQRKMIALGFGSLTGALLIFSFAPVIYVYWIGSVLFGVGSALVTTTMIGSIMNSWCDKNKGTMTGIALSASGIGGAVATQLVSPIIENTDLGYRKAYLFCATVILITGIIIVLLYRNKGESTVTKKKARDVGWEGISFEEALKKPYFYICIVCIFFTGFTLQGMTGTSTAHMQDVFQDNQYVANILSSHLLILTVAKFLTGFIYDKFGIKVTFSVCAIAGVTALMFLAFMQNNALGKGLAVGYAIISCVGVPLETIMLPIFASEFFGPKSYDKALGIISGFNVAGYAVGSFAIGKICVITGGYGKGYFVFGLIMITVFFLMLYVIGASRKGRKKIAE